MEMETTNIELDGMQFRCGHIGFLTLPFSHTYPSVRKGALL